MTPREGVMRRAGRDIIIIVACGVGVLIGLQYADKPDPVGEVTSEQVQALADALEGIRPADLEPEQREAVDHARDVLESIETGDTVIVTPPADTTTTRPPTPSTPPPTAAPEAPTTTTTEGEPSFGTRLLPLPDLADPGYSPPTTEAP